MAKAQRRTMPRTSLAIATLVALAIALSACGGDPPQVVTVVVTATPCSRYARANITGSGHSDSPASRQRNYANPHANHSADTLACAHTKHPSQPLPR